MTEIETLRADLREAEHARDGETRRADYAKEHADFLAYTLGCIANEDWRHMTADDAREEARAALDAWEAGQRRDAEIRGPESGGMNQERETGLETAKK